MGTRPFSTTAACHLASGQSANERRRSLRQIVGTAVLVCLLLGLLIENISRVPEDKAFLFAPIFSLPMAVILWAVYRGLRFLLAR
jgi:hypothetical protein